MHAEDRQVTYNVALEVAFHEAVIRQAYKDSGGVWTWSVGLTSATGHLVERYVGKPQTIEHCMAIYVWALNRYADAVRDVFKGHTMSEAQFAAALSFHWNTGALRRASWVGYWKSGKYAAAERSFKQYNKDGGLVVQGLVTRRKQEADLLFRGKWQNNGKMKEYTRLTTRHTPVWKSGVMIDVAAPLRAAFAQPALVVEDRAPKPDAIPSAPTLTPRKTEAPKPVGKVPAVIIAGATVAGVTFWDKISTWWISIWPF